MREYGGILGPQLGVCVASQCTGPQPGDTGPHSAGVATGKVYGVDVGHTD